MRILIAGAGSIGTVLGILLSSSHDVTLLRRKHRGKISIRIVGQTVGEVSLPVVDNVTVTGRFDLIFVTCQAQHTSELLLSLPKNILKASILVSLQNGVKNHIFMKDNFSNPIVAGTVWWSASLLSDEKVYYHRSADTVIGLVRGDKSHLDVVFSLLSPHFNTKTTDDIETELYKKLLLNTVSPVLALVKQPYPTGLNNPVARLLTKVMFEEAAVALHRAGIDLRDRRLQDFYSILSTDKVLNEYEGEYVHRVSTQIGLEKYGGSGSNIHELLGELINIANNKEVPTLTKVLEFILNLDRDYSPLSEDELVKLISFTSSPNENTGRGENSEHTLSDFVKGLLK